MSSERPLLEVMMLDVMLTDAILKSRQGATDHNVKDRKVRIHLLFSKIRLSSLHRKETLYHSHKAT